jgi:hypothetical protein
VKKHGDFIGVFHYLKTFHKKSRKVSGPYEELNRRSLYELFTPRGKLKPNVKVVVEKGIAFIVAKKHFSNPETRLELKDEFVEKHACC